MLEYTVNISKEDYLKFNYHSMLNSNVGRKSLLTMRILGPAIFLMTYFILRPSNPVTITAWLFLWIGMCILWIAFSKKILLSNLKSTIKQFEKDGKLPYSEVSRLVFGEEDVHEYSDDAETITKYPMFKNIYITDDGIYMYVNTTQAIIIPDSCFVRAAEKREFV